MSAQKTLTAIAEDGARLALGGERAAADHRISQALGWAQCAIHVGDLETQMIAWRAWVWIWAAVHYKAGRDSIIDPSDRFLMYGDTK